MFIKFMSIIMTFYEVITNAYVNEVIDWNKGTVITVL